MHYYTTNNRKVTNPHKGSEGLSRFSFRHLAIVEVGILVGAHRGCTSRRKRIDALAK